MGGGPEINLKRSGSTTTDGKTGRLVHSRNRKCFVEKSRIYSSVEKQKNPTRRRVLNPATSRTPARSAEETKGSSTEEADCVDHTFRQELLPEGAETVPKARRELAQVLALYRNLYWSSLIWCRAHSGTELRAGSVVGQDRL